MQTKGPNILQCSVMWFTHLQASTGTPEACPTHSHIVHLHPSPKSFMTQQSLGDHFQCHGSVILLCKNETCELHTVFFPCCRCSMFCPEAQTCWDGEGEHGLGNIALLKRRSLLLWRWKLVCKLCCVPKATRDKQKQTAWEYIIKMISGMPAEAHTCANHISKSHIAL